MKYDVFLSYSHNDSERVDVITRALDALGIKYFSAKGIMPGSPYALSIMDAIDNSEILVFVYSSVVSDSSLSVKELDYAVGKGKRILPIRYDNTPYFSELIYLIGDINYIDLSKVSDIHQVEDILYDRFKRIFKRPFEKPTLKQREANREAAEIRRKGDEDYVPKKINQDIFISYRRVDGRDYARNIKQALQIAGYPNVFFDYTSIRDGVFNTQIVDAIYSCNDFILVISPLALKNCGREGDWVTKEIRLALKYNKKIIPLVIEDTFNGWPDDFPEDLHSIKNLQFHKLMTDEYFEDSMDKLVKRLSTKVSSDPKAFGFQSFVEPEEPTKDTTIYKIKVNCPCILFIDDEETIRIEANTITKVPLPKGVYIRKVVATEDENIFDEQVLVLDHERAEIIKLR